jgi:hypothetical protein
MSRQLRELDRLDAVDPGRRSPSTGWIPEDPRNWSALAPSPATRGARLNRLWRRGVMSALVVAGLFAAVHFVPALRADATDGAAHQANANWPPVGAGEARHARGRPPGQVPTGNHAFLSRQQGLHRSPVAWDPCRQIHYVTSGVPPRGAEHVVDTAVREISKATGLQFVDDGPTKERPTSKRAPYLPQRYGKVWAPVLVSWTTPHDIPILAGDVAGRGGATGVSSGAGLEVYVSGDVILDRPQLSKLRAAGGKAEVLAVVLHEFGHLVGLAHVKDRTQIMNPVGVPGVNHYKAGDREGLAILGRGRCAPDV